MTINRRTFLSQSAVATLGIAAVTRPSIAFANETGSVDIGRETQLLIDDSIIQRQTGLVRRLHQPTKQGLIKEMDGRDFERGAVYLGKIVCRDNSGKFHMTYCWNGEHLTFYRDGRPYYNNRMRNSSTAWATLRVDGFVSLDAQTETGELHTKPIRFDGNALSVNLVAPRGELRCELQDDSDKPVAGFSLAESVPVTGDGISVPVRWQNNPDLKSLAGRPVRLRFELKNGSLYSFQFA